MPAPKRKTVKAKVDVVTSKREDKALQRAAQRAWMLDQKRNAEQKEEDVPEVVEEEKGEDIKDSEADSGVEDNNDTLENDENDAVEEPATEESATEETAQEDMEVEEDGPLEDWTVKELKEECKTLGLSDKGKKTELIERIKEAKATETAPAVEVSVEEDVVEVSSVEEAAVEEAVVEEAAEVDAVEEPAADAPVAEEEVVAPESMEIEEDGPLEEWTVKELKEECKTLGLSDKGKKI